MDVESKKTTCPRRNSHRKVCWWRYYGCCYWLSIGIEETDCCRSAIANKRHLKQQEKLQ
jgi:hypothetical protein